MEKLNLRIFQYAKAQAFKPVALRLAVQRKMKK
jgi:hypothetical protein